MRVKSVSTNGLEVFAVSGTNVITLGINLPDNKRAGLLGFSIERTEHFADGSKTTNFLDGMKVFESVVPAVQPGEIFSTNLHPIQDFFWSDFTVRDGRKYTYRILARKGVPANLTIDDAVSVTIDTEDYSKSHKHTAYFNRGVAGSQAFVRKFGEEKFDKIVKEKIWVWDWLSRGLREALISFIKEAKDDNFSIRGAVYEFQYEPVLNELFNASKRGVDVKVIYDAMPDKPNKKDPTKPKKNNTRIKNEKAIKNTLLKNLVIPRINCGALPHNKFFILIKNNVPVAVWTGSTNLTTGGIHGHSNVGHLVRDKEIAKKYFDYWTLLQTDPVTKDLKDLNLQISADFSPQNKLTGNKTEVIFSPRKKLSMLDWYSDQLRETSKAVFITIPFNLDKRFVETLKNNGNELIYVSCDKNIPVFDDVAVTNNKFNRLAHGDMLDKDNELLGWFRERLTGLNTNRFIHTKFMVVDPLGTSPLVVTGSANFSENSTTSNDENMLIIKGDQRTADMYFGEFLRIFRHFYFRSVQKAVGVDNTTKRVFIDETDGWSAKFYDIATPNFAERLYFSGN
jgi:phosphatidylserine/phosphatidylglycerophosphate/cardiolipin synthase-like enzyme